MEEFPTSLSLCQSTGTVEDNALVDRAKGGEEAAWAELVRRHHVAVYRVAHCALLRESDADDAAQEAWVAAWQRLDGFRGEASFRTWLLTIAWHKALDRRRSVARLLERLVRQRPRNGDGNGDNDGDGLDGLPDRSARGADEALVSRQQRHLMARALRGLPRAYRDCLLLAAGGEMTYEEMATLLDTPVGTIKWRVSEARRRLRTRMEGLQS